MPPHPSRAAHILHAATSSQIVTHHVFPESLARQHRTAGAGARRFQGGGHTPTQRRGREAQRSAPLREIAFGRTPQSELCPTFQARTRKAPRSLAALVPCQAAAAPHRVPVRPHPGSIRSPYRQSGPGPAPSRPGRPPERPARFAGAPPAAASPEACKHAASPAAQRAARETRTARMCLVRSRTSRRRMKGVPRPSAAVQRLGSRGPGRIRPPAPACLCSGPHR
mmetsp:Transcript_51825/g.116359  ORF Transcript_51825/g.116359 Transcript_51825/m.116359 type:complete len:224 (-) Transcript_51825:43-714(-)